MSLEQIWDVVPNLNILDNSIFVVNKENLFTYLGWLVISRFIHRKTHLFVGFTVATGVFQFVNAQDSSYQQFHC